MLRHGSYLVGTESLLQLLDLQQVEMLDFRADHGLQSAAVIECPVEAHVAVAAHADERPTQGAACGGGL